MRKIIHVDMDCFYAAVEAKYRPELKGKPLGVGGPPNTRSVLTTASYEARKYGVRSAMPSSQAVRLCPELILVAPNFELYKKESRAVREIFARYTDLIEPLSLDEAYLDVTEASREKGSATWIASEIRECIRKEVGLTASAGIAPNKFLAKIASDWKKPDGQFVIAPEHIEKFMPPLKIEKIYGVGKVTAKKMHELGIFTCGDLQNRSLEDLKLHFGSRAKDYYELSRGIDERPVDTSSERKSLTVEETFEADLKTYPEWVERLPNLYEDWDRRMHKYQDTAEIRGAVIKVKFHDFKTMTREQAMRGRPTVDDFKSLLLKVWSEREEPIRLLGLGVRFGGERSSKRPETDQLSLLPD